MHRQKRTNVALFMVLEQNDETIGSRISILVVVTAFARYEAIEKAFKIEIDASLYASTEK